jgi:hypothetical protein
MLFGFSPKVGRAPKAPVLKVITEESYQAIRQPTKHPVKVSGKTGARVDRLRSRFCQFLDGLRRRWIKDFHAPLAAPRFPSSHGLPNRLLLGRLKIKTGQVIDFIGALGEIRTPDPQIRSLMLYPAELRARPGWHDGLLSKAARGVPPGRPASRSLAATV